MKRRSLTAVCVWCTGNRRSDWKLQKHRCCRICTKSLRQPEPEARRVATALELYCTGSLNLFNHPTNVKTDSRVVCIVLKNMGENLRKIAMHITNEFVSQAVDQNFHEGAATWCYFDEFHILLRDPLTASYFVAVWKMLRKKDVCRLL